MRGWPRFIFASCSIGVSCAVAVAAIIGRVQSCRCSPTLLGLDLKNTAAVLTGLAFGSLLMTIMGFYFKQRDNQ